MNHSEINIGTLGVALAASMITAWFTTQVLRRHGFNGPGLIGFIAGALAAYGVYQLDERLTQSITYLYAGLGLILVLLVILGGLGKISQRFGRTGGNRPPDTQFRNQRVHVKNTRDWE